MYFNIGMLWLDELYDIMQYSDACTYWLIHHKCGSYKGVVCPCLFAQLCLTLCDAMDCSPPGFSVCRILQARILEWVAISCSRGSSQPRDRTCVSCISCIGR